ncbi:MAG: hypothetical protein EXR07_10340 [Acetobacteraceae bacterium]|nr:hypothetical protein [Acetobacteraceae bacterium]
MTLNTFFKRLRQVFQRRVEIPTENPPSHDNAPQEHPTAAGTIHFRCYAALASAHLLETVLTVFERGHLSTSLIPVFFVFATYVFLALRIRV